MKTRAEQLCLPLGKPVQIQYLSLDDIHSYLPQHIEEIMTEVIIALRAGSSQFIGRIDNDRDEYGF